ncbi:hypothetical protein RIF29_16458 [Crotalaria pallida]|uniref:Uncharacterized protein n=1 Tax=Crotalaria pallida TaxID=3830 RepID=A0AAN9FGK6_CROPI
MLVSHTIAIEDDEVPIQSSSAESHLNSSTCQATSGCVLISSTRQHCETFYLSLSPVYSTHQNMITSTNNKNKINNQNPF